MRGKCNCGKKATGEYLIRYRGTAHTLKMCDDCKPVNPAYHPNVQLIDGK